MKIELRKAFKTITVIYLIKTEKEIEILNTFTNS